MLIVAGVTQLTHLDHNIVAEMCRQLFPQSLQLCDETELSCLQHLSERWVVEFWHYLARWFPDDLSLFEHLHLIPDGNGKLLPLDSTKAVIVLGYSDSTLPNAVKEICRHLGVRVIEEMMLSICNRENVWGKYILHPDAEGVLTALSRLEVEEMIQLFCSLSDDDRALLRTYILSSAVAKPDILRAGHNILRVLPMFETLPVITKENSTDTEHQMVSLEDVSVAGPSLPVKYRELVLDVTDPVLQQLLPEMNVEKLSISTCLTRFVFPAINDDLYSIREVEALMTFVFNSWATLRLDSSFVSSVRCVKFVTRESGVLVIPSDLFDGDDLVLRTLFRGQDVFPLGIFASQYANILREVGLKGQDSVTAADVYRVIQELDQSSCATVETAKTVLHFLEQHSELLYDELPDLDCHLLNVLKTRRWVPFIKCRPSQYPQALRFCSDSCETVVATPDMVTSAKYCQLIGSVKLTVDTAEVPKLAEIFEWNDDQGIDNVLLHLLNLSADYSPKETMEFISILRAIYQYLNQQEEIVMNEFRQMVENEKWIFHGRGFAEVQRVVKCEPFTDFRPHVFVLCDEFIHFERLWNAVGVMDNCYLVDVINNIASAHDGHDYPTDVVKRDLQLAVAILNEIASFDDTKLLEIRDYLLVPLDIENVLQMKPIAECTYCDPERFHQGFGAVSRAGDNVHFIHRLIPVNTAIRLKIHSIVSRTLNGEELDIGLTSYGQTEELTTRLRTLLEREYMDGLAVIKELIQNADDAVATEIRLLYDERENSRAQVNLLDSGMKGLQGPALWVYNDATFRDDDFDNLVKLNAATKQHRTDKIGQFGLGFNAVYNLTDVPALISRNYLVYLDPHRTYLGEALRDKPGIKLNLKASEKWLSYFSDQFEPFNGIFGCHLTDTRALTDYGGTLFRFPLRTKEQSHCSKISNKDYSRDEMTALLNMLQQAADYLLLFTQNVVKVSVFHLTSESESPQDMYELFSVRKNMERILRSPIHEEERPFAVLEHASRKMKQNEIDCPDMQFSFLMKMSVECQPDGQNVLATEQDSRVTYWLTAMCLGRERSLSISVEKQDRIPLGGVAAKLDNLNDQDFNAVSVSYCGDNYNGGIIFCFLPLPLTTSSGLPVHINGYFAIDLNRKHLAMKTADQKSNDDAFWNEHLMTDAVKFAYEILLEDVLKVCQKSEPFNIWPLYCSSARDDNISQLVDRLYYDISGEHGRAVCRVNNKCVPLRMCKMLDVGFRMTAVGDKAQRVFQQVKSTDFEVLDLPMEVLKSLLLTSAETIVRDYIVSKADFYSQWFLPNIAKADRDLRDHLVMYALFDDEIRCLLQNFECIPVRPNGALRKPSNLIDPTSPLAVLYNEEDKRFPLISEEQIQRYEASDIYSKLVDVGMKRDNISWKELSERCTVVTQIRKLVSKRLRILMQLMSSSVDTVLPEDEKYIDKIREERFLPVKPKEHRFSLPWKGDEVEYTSCTEAYLSDCTSLVCCSFPIIDDRDKFGLQNANDKLKHKLQLIKPINEQTVLHQLDCIIFQLSESSKQQRTTSVPHVGEFCSAIYEYFEQRLQKYECLEITEELRKRRCILVHTENVLMYPEHCARPFTGMPVGSEALLPYLYTTPYVMNRSYDKFFEAVGVKKMFTAEDYVTVLRHIKDDRAEEPLTDNDLEVVIAIINRCLPSCSELPATDDVYVPNTTGVLCKADTACMNIYCDGIGEDDVEGNICHEKIAPGAAKKLGIKTIRQEYLMQNSDDFGLPFGQEEELTTRLHNIVRDCRFDENVLKEMLQNADDAGATQLHLINDERKLQDRLVFDDSWKPLQGPALCVYNNKPFTNDDLKGIQKLGKGSKGEDATKTGQYGIGFNCVYHLTDVPSLLTSVNGEQVLCIFDPHCQYITGARKESPGRMIRNVEQLKSKYPDVFQGYLLPEYAEQSGSLFRLPLRSEEMSETSKISDNVVTSDTVRELFTEFQRDMYKSLLFLNSVEEISLRIINKDSTDGDTCTSFSVTAKMSAAARQDRATFMSTIKRVAKEMKSTNQLPENCRTLDKVCYELTTEDSDGNVDEWLIVQCLGFDSSIDLDCFIADYTTGRMDLLPRAGVAHLTSTDRGRTNEVGNQLFCFLPLADAQLNIPVNVNGHFFLNCEARQNLWAERNEDRKSAWNFCLMKNTAAPAYCSLIELRRQQTEDVLQNAQQQDQVPPTSYFSVFPPVGSNENTYINSLCMSVYMRLQDSAVLPTYCFNANQFTWLKPSNCSVRDGFFDDILSSLTLSESRCQQDRQNSHEKKSENIYKVVKNILLKCGLKILDCPLHIYRNFEAAGVSVKVLHPEDVLKFFLTYDEDGTTCLVQNVNVPVSETLFKDLTTVGNLLSYCALADRYKQMLIGTPLLVTVDNNLRLFDESCVRYEPRFADVLPHIPHQFMHKSVFHALKLNPKSDTQV